MLLDKPIDLKSLTIKHIVSLTNLYENFLYLYVKTYSGDDDRSDEHIEITNTYHFEFLKCIIKYYYDIKHKHNLVNELINIIHYNNEQDSLTNYLLFLEQNGYSFDCENINRKLEVLISDCLYDILGIESYTDKYRTLYDHDFCYVDFKNNKKNNS